MSLPDTLPPPPTAHCADRLLPAPVGGGFAMDGWWVWCGSVVHGEDGRWPMSHPMFQGYTVCSEIVRAVADTPVGPYTFVELAFSNGGERLVLEGPFIWHTGDGPAASPPPPAPGIWSSRYARQLRRPGEPPRSASGRN